MGGIGTAIADIRQDRGPDGIAVQSRGSGRARWTVPSPDVVTDHALEKSLCFSPNPDRRLQQFHHCGAIMMVIEKLQSQLEKINSNFYMGQRVSVHFDGQHTRVCDEYASVVCELQKLESVISNITGEESWVKLWTLIDSCAVVPSEIIQGSIVKPKKEAYSSLTSGCSVYEVAIVLDKDPFTLVSLSGDMMWSCTCRAVDFDIVGHATSEQMERVKHRR